MSTNLTIGHIGMQVSPVSLELICKHGMYGRIEAVELNRATVRWADGSASEHYQSELELVGNLPVPSPVEKKE